MLGMKKEEAKNSQAYMRLIILAPNVRQFINRIRIIEFQRRHNASNAVNLVCHVGQISFEVLLFIEIKFQAISLERTQQEASL
jgi:hypothetical protein